jgi:hypothetical protein
MSFQHDTKDPERTMHILFPFKSVCASFVFFLPCGVISLGHEVSPAFFREPWKTTTHYSVTSSSTMSATQQSELMQGVHGPKGKLTDEIVEPQ